MCLSILIYTYKNQSVLWLSFFQQRNYIQIFFRCNFHIWGWILSYEAFQITNERFNYVPSDFLIKFVLLYSDPLKTG